MPTIVNQDQGNETFFMLITVKISTITIVGILSFISTKINTISDGFDSKKSLYIWAFSFFKSS